MAREAPQRKGTLCLLASKLLKDFMLLCVVTPEKAGAWKILKKTGFPPSRE